MRIRSVVRDVPAEAADVLERLGYTVVEPAGDPPSRGSVTLRTW